MSALDWSLRRHLLCLVGESGGRVGHGPLWGCMQRRVLHKVFIGLLKDRLLSSIVGWTLVGEAVLSGTPLVDLVGVAMDWSSHGRSTAAATCFRSASAGRHWVLEEDAILMGSQVALDGLFCHHRMVKSRHRLFFMRRLDEVVLRMGFVHLFVVKLRPLTSPRLPQRLLSNRLHGWLRPAGLGSERVLDRCWLQLIAVIFAVIVLFVIIVFIRHFGKHGSSQGC